MECFQIKVIAHLRSQSEEAAPIAGLERVDSHLEITIFVYLVDKGDDVFGAAHSNPPFHLYASLGFRQHTRRPGKCQVTRNGAHGGFDGACGGEGGLWDDLTFDLELATMWLQQGVRVKIPRPGMG